MPMSTAVSADRVLGRALDRKSTRLNSSHSQISYAVFCLTIKMAGRAYPAVSCEVVLAPREWHPLYTMQHHGPPPPPPPRRELVRSLAQPGRLFAPTSGVP